jgi:putative acetyltransferase
MLDIFKGNKKIKKASKVHSVRQTSREMVRELGFLNSSRLYHGLSLSHTQIHALLEIEKNKAMTSAELSDLLQLEKSTISRLINSLECENLVSLTKNPEDSRSKLIILTPKGMLTVTEINDKANTQVTNALNKLSHAEQELVEKGLQSYCKALRLTRLLSEYELRLIKPEDNTGLKDLIVTTLKTFGAARTGFAFQDESLNDMYSNYNKPGACYYVIVKNGKVYGGAGIDKLKGYSIDKIAEVQKMYFKEELRGLGFGKHIMGNLLEEAQKMGYKKCYLETLVTMEKANKLYQAVGFELLDKPLGDTGHFGCDRWYIKDLTLKI